MRGKNPTYEQKRLLSRLGYDATAWLVVKNTSAELVIVSRDGASTVTIKKD